MSFGLKIEKNQERDIGLEAKELIRKLFPICRSITGEGVRESLSVISDLIPLKVNEVESGTKVLDWMVPKEWNIVDAWIKDSKGNKIIDFKKTNLHVLNYSIPIHKNIDLSELKKHIYSLPEKPDWIPYRTTYHNQDWGFCMAYNQLISLEEDKYEVKIDSSLKKGSLTYGEYYKKGRTNEEVLISTHICHPSLANDNLSGLVLSALVAELISKIDTKYSYRFLFIPGTIGSITWLSLNEDKIDKIKYGFVLTLLGDENNFHYKKSRDGNTEIDRIIENCLKHFTKKYKILDFSPYGYDERQYCSPGFNLPIGRISRSVHGEFPEYHTSADNLDFVKEEKLEESYDLLLSIINTIEENNTYVNLYPKGEPQLGRRGLFKKIGGQSKSDDFQMALLWVLNQSDGNSSLLDICIKSKLSFELIYSAADVLEKTSLIRKKINT